MIKLRLGRILYKTIGNILPDASNRFLGKQAKAFRAFTAKLMFKSVGVGVNFEKGVNASYKLSIGNYSGIGENAYIQGETHIGDYVMMAKNVRIFTINHNFKRLDIPMSKQGTSKEKPVFIGNDVWIGDSAMIMPGSKIGNGVIIGGGSVVRGEIPDNAILEGNPATIVSYREHREP